MTAVPDTGPAASGQDVVSVLPMGERALLVELPGTAQVLGLHADLRAHPLPGQVDVVAATRTVLVRLDRAIAAADLQRFSVPPAATAEPTGHEVVVDTVYDGEDLADVAACTGLGIDGVIAAHTSARWRVAFTGFAPGFGYLVADELPWAPIPRRATSRTGVPAGAVGLAGEYSGIYPRASPGGWQLIGRTAAPLWRLDREPPALLRPGVRVRFRSVPALPDLPPDAVAPGGPDLPPDAGAPAGPDLSPAAFPTGGPDLPADALRGPGPDPDRALVVTRPGLLTTVQDRGRVGHADLGVTTSGAADRASARAANRCVGNDPAAAVLETTLGGLTVTARGPQVVAVTGAPAPVTVDGVPVPMHEPTDVPDGAELHLGRPTSGLRTYLAVRGGVDVPEVLGSRSTDLLSGLGPAVVRRGDVLPVGFLVAGDPEPGAPLAYPTRLEILPGPRAAWFAADALVGSVFSVSPRSNRVGLRLAGPTLTPLRRGELPSEGLVAGAIQVPPSGEPVLFLADHPVTGGYPVIAVLTQASIDAAAQLRPGETVRFELSGG